MKQFTKILILNMIIILLFVSLEYQIWSVVSSNPPFLTRVAWTPFFVSVRDFAFVNNMLEETMGSNEILNLPFWLFFVSIAVNLYYISKKYNSQE